MLLRYVSIMTLSMISIAHAMENTPTNYSEKRKPFTLRRKNRLHRQDLDTTNAPVITKKSQDEATNKKRSNPEQLQKLPFLHLANPYNIDAFFRTEETYFATKRTKTGADIVFTDPDIKATLALAKTAHSLLSQKNPEDRDQLEGILGLTLDDHNIGGRCYDNYDIDSLLSHIQQQNVDPLVSDPRNIGAALGTVRYQSEHLEYDQALSYITQFEESLSKQWPSLAETPEIKQYLAGTKNAVAPYAAQPLDTKQVLSSIKEKLHDKFPNQDQKVALITLLHNSELEQPQPAFSPSSSFNPSYTAKLSEKLEKGFGLPKRSEHQKTYIKLLSQALAAEKKRIGLWEEGKEYPYFVDVE